MGWALWSGRRLSLPHRPVHLEKIVGAGNPVAVALDGYAIYGYNDPNGKPPTDLDWLNGHKGPMVRITITPRKHFPI